MKIRPEEITTVLEKELESYEAELDVDEVGTVLEVGDGIARIYGLSGAMSGEMLDFGNELYGLALNLEEDVIGAVILGDDVEIKEGEEVRRTGRVLEVPVGPALLGRVVNSLGQPLDGKGPVTTEHYRQIEFQAPGIVARQPVKEPLQTGLKAVDSMVPIGRGQRELIIGDRGTGKTAVAIDAIINQKGGDVFCVYVAVGQKASTVAGVVERLEKEGAMDYTIVVSTPAATPAPLQYIAPTPGPRWPSSSCTAARTASPRRRRTRDARPWSSTTISPSRPPPTGSCRSSCAVRRDARRTPATSSTSTRGSSNALPSCRTRTAAAP